MPGVGDFIPLSSAAFQILVALASGPKHGYAVMGEVRLNPGTLYTTIKRLLDDELIRETATPSAADHDDRRRYYSITVLGRRVARAELERLQGVIERAAGQLREKPAR
jgi:DNA-binding PadR family transcriptional regulator